MCSASYAASLKTRLVTLRWCWVQQRQSPEEKVFILGRAEVGGRQPSQMIIGKIVSYTRSLRLQVAHDLSLDDRIV